MNETKPFLDPFVKYEFTCGEQTVMEWVKTRLSDYPFAPHELKVFKREAALGETRGGKHCPLSSFFLRFQRVLQRGYPSEARREYLKGYIASAKKSFVSYYSGDNIKKKWTKAFRMGLILFLLAYIVAFSSVYRGTENSRSENPSFSNDMRQMMTPESYTSFKNGVFNNQSSLYAPKVNPRINARKQTPNFLAPKSKKRPRLISTSVINTLGVRRLKMGPRLAICLVGGAREFQLTGPSIITKLLSTYSFADVFLHAPLDENSHKFSILQAAAPNLVHVRVVPDVPVPESNTTDQVLQWVKGGPERQPRQQLLQQFKGIETCKTMITEYEAKHNIEYDWIMRTRVDGFWTANPPPLNSLDTTGYTIPSGSDWGGLNDRLAIGKRITSLHGLRRLTVLKDLVKAGYRKLNAERTYDAQLEHLKVKVTRASFPFCILSHKIANVAFPMVPSISSKAYLNGAKCRPCKASLVGWEASEYIAELPQKLYGPEQKGVDLCNAREPWDSGWEQVYDKFAGQEAADVRKYFQNRTLSECVRDWREFRPTVTVWDSPLPVAICIRGKLGPIARLGSPYGDWPVFLQPLNSKSVIYSTGAGEHYTQFDYSLIRLLKCKVHGFELTPQGLNWLGDNVDNIPPNWIHHPWMLSSINGETKFYPLYMDGRSLEYSTSLPNDANSESWKNIHPLILDSKQVLATMRLLKHKQVDVLRIVGHYTQHESILRQWIVHGSTPKVCQVIISYHRQDKHFGSSEGQVQLEELRQIGLELATCIQSDPSLKARNYETCLFFSIHHCFSKNRFDQI